MATTVRLGAFYYPWYGNLTTDSGWVHWDENSHAPPDDIGADFYPSLGPYSSNLAATVDQHMAWLAQSGVGVVITSWWGEDAFTDDAVSLLLNKADIYGLKVAFHIEPYAGANAAPGNKRTVAKVKTDIEYIYTEYGSHDAFFRTTRDSLYMSGSNSKGVFFVYDLTKDNIVDENALALTDWDDTLDDIHGLSDETLVIGLSSSGDSDVVSVGKFDGVYQYATLSEAPDINFNWANSLPERSLFVPCVIPGYSGERIGYDPGTTMTRDDGDLYDEQWTAAPQSSQQVVTEAGG